MMAFCKCEDGLKAWLLACTLISNSAYAMIAPFLPIEIESMGISTIWVGPIFAIYSVGIIAFSPLVSRLMPCLGAANVIALGMAGMGISLACFGLMMFSNNANVIIGFALITRFVEGAASAFIQTTCYTIATNDYPNDQEQLVGLMEAMTGVGILLGPVIGSALYAVTSFETTFLLFGAVIFATAFVFKYGFPKSTGDSRAMNPKGSHVYPNKDIEDKDQNNTNPKENDESAQNSDVEDKEAICGASVGSAPSSADISQASEDQLVPYWQLAKRARCLLGLVSAALSYFMICFLEPILSQRLLLDFELSVPQIGFFFALFALFYIPTSVCVQWIPNWIEKRVTIALSLLVSSFAFLLVGPSQTLHFPDSLLMMGIGWCLLGISLATFLVPILPEMVETSLPCFPGQEKRVNTMCSGLFNSFLGIGQCISPLYGSILSDRVGFRLTNDIVAIIGFTFFIIYFVFADVRHALQKSFGRMEATASQQQQDLDDTRIEI